MSAPERLWIDRGPRGGWMHRDRKMPDSEHEFVRTDLMAAALTAAGYRIFAPGELDAATIEACIEAVRSVGQFFGEQVFLSRSPDPELVEALALIDAFVAQEVDYMTRNNLGDPEAQHNVKWARALLSRIREGGEG